MSHHHRPFDSHFNPQSRGVQYGLLRGKVVRFGTEEGTKTPHFQIIVKDDTEQIWRIAVNVRSDDGSNDQAIAVDPLDNHPVLSRLGAVAVGYTPLPDHKPGLALDFVREPLFDPSQLEILPPFGSDQSGLEDVLSALTQTALETGEQGRRPHESGKPTSASSGQWCLPGWRNYIPFCQSRTICWLFHEISIAGWPKRQRGCYHSGILISEGWLGSSAIREID